MMLAALGVSPHDNQRRLAQRTARRAEISSLRANYSRVGLSENSVPEDVDHRHERGMRFAAAPVADFA
jgi:hypothetical protein